MMGGARFIGAGVLQLGLRDGTEVLFCDGVERLKYVQALLKCDMTFYRSNTNRRNVADISDCFPSRLKLQTMLLSLH